MRLHLVLALITAVALVLTLRAEKHHALTFPQIEQMAQKRAAGPYVPLPDVLPPQLQKLTPQQEAGIFSKETARLWRKQGLPFQIDFYHQLKSNPIPHIAPRFYSVDRKGSHDLPYSSAFFNYLDVSANPPRPLILTPPLPANLGYAGFYVRYPNMGIGTGPNSLDGFFSALGASYFRVLAKEQVYGLSGRGIAINTSLDDPKRPEEFPAFTDWWLHVPGSQDTELVLDAILDGPSVCGAYEFRIHPGAVTSVDIHASLFFRRAVDRLGIAPFSSMYLYGENSNDHFKDNIHPEIHDSDGLMIQSAKDEWTWQPLEQSDDKRTGAPGYQLQTYAIGEQSPKGFGLIQRDRDFAHYQDLVMRYNVRPSAWVMPHSGFDSGEVTLFQRPSDDFNTDNVVLLWHPAEPIHAGDHKDYSYTIDFYMNDAARPPLAYTKQTLVNVPAPPPPAPPLVLPPTVPGAKPAAPTNAPAASSPKPGTNAPGSLPPPPRPFVGPPAPTGKPIPVGTTPVQFLVDFSGAGIENTPANQPPDLDLTFDPPETYLREKSVEKNSYDNSWRVTFTIIPFKHFTPTLLKCRLLHNNRPITETWTYTWRQ
jgi:glucans biosynthesis protein